MKVLVVGLGAREHALVLALSRDPAVTYLVGAPGKGVLVTEDLIAAESFARDALSALGARVVIEDYLDGPEVSLFAVTDGGPSSRCCRRRTTSGSATTTPVCVQHAGTRVEDDVVVRVRGGFSRSDIAAKAVRGEISVPSQGSQS